MLWIEIYGSMSETLSNRLRIVSNKLLKILFNMSPFHSTNQLHKELDILKVKYVYKSHVLKFVFQCLNHTMLFMYNNHFQKRESLHDRNQRDMKNLHVSVGYSVIALSSTRINGTKMWNELPLEIWKIDDAICFKNSLKSHFMESYTWFQVRYVISWHML